MKRQANGNGSIRKRADGRWEGRYYTPDGKQHSVYSDRQSEVRKKVIKILVQMDENDYLDETDCTVAEWMNEWINDFVDVKFSTQSRYEMDIRRTIAPCIGKIRLKDLTTTHLQRMYNKCKKDGLSAKSIRNLHGVMHSALDKAVKIGMIKKNVSENCELPKIRKVEMHPLTDEKLTEFLKEARSDKYYKLYYVDVFTGLRESELLGLTWDCIDFDRGTIRVYRQYVKVAKSKEGHRQFGFTTLKNDCERTIEPASQVMEMLRRVQKEQASWRMKCGQLWQNDLNMVFTNQTGGPIRYENFYKHLKKIAIRINYPELRVHDLRHTYATLSLQNGSDLKTLSQSLGHSTTAFTLDRYGHVSNTMRRENAQKMERFIASI